MFIQKEDVKTKHCFCVFVSLFFIFVFQETDPFKRGNLIMPGSLLPFKKEIADIFEKQKLILFRKQRYAKGIETLAFRLFSPTGAT